MIKGYVQSTSQSHGPIPHGAGVSLILASSSQVPQGNVINAEFHQSVHVIAQQVTAQAEKGATGAFSVEATRVGQFMKMGPPTCTGVKVEEEPYGFLDEMEKIFWVIQATNVEGVNFTAYKLKDVGYQWYEEWDNDRGDIEEEGLWEAFFNDFLDWFFP